MTVRVSRLTLEDVDLMFVEWKWWKRDLFRTQYHCLKCGAIVWSNYVHALWHEQLEGRNDETSSRTNSG